MTVYVATKNAGKLRELREIFGGSGWDLRPYPGYRDVVEGDVSYAANAALKARALWDQLRAEGLAAAVLGDDSGLEVFALGGRPGVRSARYGGADATWAQRRSALLAEVLAAGAGRGARFVCALHFIAADGSETDAIAVYDGLLSLAERGTAGFSYDPIFESPEDGRTFAELEESEKNLISHRARAARALLEKLETRAGDRAR